MTETDAVDGDGEPIERTNRATNVEISAHRSSPERVVFTEHGNSEGWISMDAELAARLER